MTLSNLIPKESGNMSIIIKATQKYSAILGQKGFTLTELLVVVMVLAVIAVLAIPSLIASQKSQEANSLRVNLETFIRNGRQHSMIYQQPIILCTTDIDGNCVAKNGISLLSFIDKNNNHKFDINQDVLIEKTSVNPKYGYLDLRVSLNKPYMQLTAMNGQALGSMGHIKYCPHDGKNTNKFKVKFSKSGIPTTIANKDEATDC